MKPRIQSRLLGREVQPKERNKQTLKGDISEILLTANITEILPSDCYLSFDGATRLAGREAPIVAFLSLFFPPSIALDGC